MIGGCQNLISFHSQCAEENEDTVGIDPPHIAKENEDSVDNDPPHIENEHEDTVDIVHCVLWLMFYDIIWAKKKWKNVALFSRLLS